MSAPRSPRPPQPQFLDMKSYRRKRAVDVARLVPFLGAVCVLFPLPFLFLQPGGNTASGPETGTGATALAIYFFVVWLALVLGALGLSRTLKSQISAD